MPKITEILDGLSETERGEMLAELLKRDVISNNYFIPQEAYDTVCATFALPFVELVLVRKRNGVPEFLLAYRQDRDWDGWHIIGGHVRANMSFENACQTIARRELSEALGTDFAGINLKVISEVSGQKWEAGHPRWPNFNAVSRVMICVADREIPETETVRWFADVPENIIAFNGISHHGEFLERVRKALTVGFQPIALSN